MIRLDANELTSPAALKAGPEGEAPSIGTYIPHWIADRAENANRKQDKTKPVRITDPKRPEKP